VGGLKGRARDEPSRGDSADTRTRRLATKRRWRLLGAFAAVLLVGSAAWIVLGGDDPAPSEGEAADDLPAAERDLAQRTLSHIEGEGVVLSVVHDRVAELLAEPTPDACRSIADALNLEAPAPTVHEQATLVADPVIREGTFLEVRLLAEVLSDCDNAADGEALDELTSVHRLVAERLVELEMVA
jgi:hypothetical protein